MTQLDAPQDNGNAAVPGTPANPPTTRASLRQQRRRAGRTRTWWIVGVVAAVAVAAGATIGIVASSSASPPAKPPPAASTNTPAGLIDRSHNFPSPYVLTGGSKDYLYTGGNAPGKGLLIPVRSFTSLNHLSTATNAMPTVPPGSWGWVWTADVQKAASGYAMWFTTQYPARLNPEGVPNQCIGNATSSSPLGPFTPSSGPIICQTWGSIDPRSVIAPDGTHYLIWKADTNADKAAVIPTTIWEQQLAPNGITLLGSPRLIATATQPWEGALAESPDMVDLGGTYYLFFSGNTSLGANNGVGMMTCTSIQGPCNDIRTAAFIGSNSQGTGPGEESLFQQNGNTWLLYSPNAIFGTYYFRPLAVARVVAGTHGPYVAAFHGAVPGV